MFMVKIKQIFGAEMEAKEHVSCVNVMTHNLVIAPHGGFLSRHKYTPFSCYSFDIYARNVNKVNFAPLGKIPQTSQGSFES